MRLPKKVCLAGKEWDVIREKDRWGGWFSCRNKTICVGLQGSDEDQRNTFLHEVLEVILTEKNYRFSLYGNESNGAENFRFFFNHEEYIRIMQDFGLAVRDLIK